MNVHKNARLTLRRRQELVRQLEAGAPLKGQARRLEISVRTARKWWGRYRTEGSAGLLDRSSRPHDSPARTAAPLQLAVKVLRWQHWTGAQIASALGISAATARRILRRSGLNRRGRLELPPVVTRYEHAAVGDLLHLDIKKLGRITYLGHRATGQRHGQRHGAGWESVHVAVDDRSRVAYVELLPDEHSDTARGLRAAGPRLVPRARGARAQGPHGQWIVLSLLRLSRHLPRLAARPSAHAPLHPPHQRQGRTLHPNPVARVGLCAALLHLRRSRPSAAGLAGAL